MLRSCLALKGKKMVNEKTDYKFFRFIKVHFYVLEENKTKATCSRQKMGYQIIIS